jgi:hypothetical protein
MESIIQSYKSTRVCPRLPPRSRGYATATMKFSGESECWNTIGDADACLGCSGERVLLECYQLIIQSVRQFAFQWPIPTLPHPPSHTHPPSPPPGIQFVCSSVSLFVRLAVTLFCTSVGQSVRLFVCQSYLFTDRIVHAKVNSLIKCLPRCTDGGIDDCSLLRSFPHTHTHIQPSIQVSIDRIVCLYL